MLASYQRYHSSEKKSRKLILQEVTSHIYSIKDKDALSKFTVRLIQVGARVALHVLNKDTSFIQFHLRWRSNVFKIYLHNVPALSVQHYEAFRAKINN